MISHAFLDQLTSCYLFLYPLPGFSVLISSDLQGCNKKGLKCGLLSLICWPHPKRAELPGYADFMGYQGVKYLLYNVQPIHHKGLLSFLSPFPSLSFTPNKLARLQTGKKYSKQALLLLPLLAGNKLLKITKQKDMRKTLFFFYMQCTVFWILFLWILYRFFPLLFVTKWGNEIKNSIVNANRPFRLYFVQ